MKIPEEIKKALRICSGKLLDYCDACNYCNWSSDCACNSRMCADALEYIQQLETHIGELTEKVAQLEAAQPKWISVEERSPERGVYFVRCIHNYTDNDEYECYKVAIYLNKEYRWIDVGNLLKVTHWMPIPELPKEDA